MAALDRDAVLRNRADAPTRSVAAPELGGELLVGKLTLADVQYVDKVRNENPTNPSEVIAALVVAGARDAAGARLFADADRAEVRGLPFEALKRVSDAVLAFNGMGGDDADAGPNPVEAARKN